MCAQLQVLSAAFTQQLSAGRGNQGNSRELPSEALQAAKYMMSSSPPKDLSTWERFTADQRPGFQNFLISTLGVVLLLNIILTIKQSSM